MDTHPLSEILFGASPVSRRLIFDMSLWADITSEVPCLHVREAVNVACALLSPN